MDGQRRQHEAQLLIRRKRVFMIPRRQANVVNVVYFTLHGLLPVFASVSPAMIRLSMAL
ncbi:MAG: hypothetical protein O7B35_16010 [Deltaproteobacteria bacterium]|nr:hypothetical protein [Deltaproteobacteria bacterium]